MPDPTDRMSCVAPTTIPDMVRIDLAARGLSAHQPVRAIDADDLALAGEVSASAAHGQRTSAARRRARP